MLLISPGSGAGSSARGAIWPSEESLRTRFDRQDQCRLGSAAQPRAEPELMGRAEGGARGQALGPLGQEGQRTESGEPAVDSSSSSIESSFIWTLWRRTERSVCDSAATDCGDLLRPLASDESGSDGSWFWAGSGRHTGLTGVPTKIE